MKQIAIVTGASSGLGRLYVKALDAGKGGNIDEIWVVARRGERLLELEMQSYTPLRIFTLDLCEDEAFLTIENALKNEPNVSVRWLINCAGFGKFGPFTEIIDKENSDMIRLNCLAVMKMCYYVLPFTKRGSHIITISSAASFLPQPNLSVYSATKSFVLNFTRSLNFELKGTGIRATAVCPKFMHTEFLANPGDHTAVDTMTFIGFEDPACVVEKSIRQARIGKSVCIPSFDMKIAYSLCKVLPANFSMRIQHQLGSHHAKTLHS